MLESKKGLRSKRTIWGPHRRALGDPSQTALPPMDEEGWHSRVEPGAFFHPGQNEIPKDTQLGLCQPQDDSYVRSWEWGMSRNPRGHP